MITNNSVGSNRIGRITVYSPELGSGYVHENGTNTPFAFSLKLVGNENLRSSLSHLYNQNTSGSASVKPPIPVRFSDNGQGGLISLEIIK